MKTVTEKWLAGKTFLQEREDWTPVDRSNQYEATPGHRCNCGEIIRPGAQVEVLYGTQDGRSHFWAECPNCGTAMF